MQQKLNSTKKRIESVDILRGIVMVIMALDHTRDFFHVTANTSDPLTIPSVSPILFFTRWITHFCAPAFVFLSGVSIYLQSFRKSKKELSSFLIKRGLWLVIAEVILLSFIFTFNPLYNFIFLEVIWAIGISMIILGLMIWLPFTAILIISFIIVFGHNLLDYYEAGLKSSPGWWYDLIHRPGFYPLWGNHYLGILYPFLPWAGLMMMGYCFGKLFLKMEGLKRKKILLWLGLAILALFVVIRFINEYGDAAKWSTQKDAVFSFLSFMNVTKYPPSLLYMCATIGIGILFLAFFANARNGLTRFIIVYGRVPFLYYVLHFLLIHLVSSVFYLLRGHTVAEGLKSDQNWILPKFAVANEGYSLFWVYIIWIGVVLSLYPVCRWFSNYKQQHREKWWLSYL